MIRHNLIAVIGVCLSLYFCYHLIAGERSYLRLMSLEHQMTQTSAQLETLTSERTDLEQRVVMMRPGSLNRDLLEEQARKVLGFQHEGERILLQSRS